MCELVFHKADQLWECTECGHKMKSFKQMLQHIRKFSDEADIRKPIDGGKANPDGHGHRWYCFNRTGYHGKDHLSFDSDEEIYAHLKECHLTIRYNP